ncbi:unnamed protein product [Bursaphelenchus okinawaensis]|uniref:Uncharacterized protein n=1 Tax=Bursaphelenchus okinawaensis TaxID=465554 RepID=A0A811KNN5_9BILA|nr:unnamed protein product [Bursaphelenchus okinawaensis]CAG9106856.1 unnamed protein product [Bursaphelenchus okinawaensis]
MSRQSKWGNYYNGEKDTKHKFVLKMIDTANQMIPSFDEMFDQETFYIFAFCFVIGSFTLSFILCKFFKIQIREYDLFPEDKINQRQDDKVEWKPVNIFKTPMQHWRDIKKLTKKNTLANTNTDTAQTRKTQ